MKGGESLFGDRFLQHIASYVTLLAERPRMTVPAGTQDAPPDMSSTDADLWLLIPETRRSMRKNQLVQGGQFLQNAAEAAPMLPGIRKGSCWVRPPVRGSCRTRATASASSQGRRVPQLGGFPGSKTH